MKKFIIAIMCALCAFGAYAENNNAATSKEYVDTELATKQPTIPAEGANAVMTFDSNATDGIGTKNIYDESASYSSQETALVTAQTANAAVQMAINGEFYCKEWSTIVENDCWLWGIKEPTPHSSSKNLFNKNNRTRIYGWFPHSGASWTYTPAAYSNRIPCKPNTTYTARYNGNSTQAVLNFASTRYDDIPTEKSRLVSTPNSIRLEHPTKETPVTITTGPNDKWLIVQYNAAEPQNTDMANNLQIKEGAVATEYVPFENLYIPENQQ